jgi:hypothetical protein
VYGHRSEKRTIPISGSLALRWPASDRNNPAACAEASACEAQWAQGIAGAQPKPKILFTKVQESQYPPSAHGRGGAQTAGMCPRIAVFLATVAADPTVGRSAVAEIAPVVAEVMRARAVTLKQRV